MKSDKKLFHKSPEFSSEYLFQHPPHKEREFVIFSTCSPIRANPIGISIVEVLEVVTELLKDTESAYKKSLNHNTAEAVLTGLWLSGQDFIQHSP